MKYWTLAIILSVIIYDTLAQEGHVHEEDFSDDDDNQKVGYSSPVVSGFAYLAESFDDQERFNAVWVRSEAKKEGIDEDISKYDGELLMMVCPLRYLHY